MPALVHIGDDLVAFFAPRFLDQPAERVFAANGSNEVLQTLLEKAAIEPDVRGVAVFADNGQNLAQVGLGTWTNPMKGRLPADHIYQIEYQDRLVYYAPITRTEVVVDDFNPDGDSAAKAGTQTRLLGWVGQERQQFLAKRVNYNDALVERRQAVVQQLRLRRLT